MKPQMRIWLLFLLGALSPRLTIGGGEPLPSIVDGRALIASVSAAYKAMQPALSIHGEISRRKLRGESWQAMKREYRVIEAGGRIRADVCQTGRDGGCIVYFRRDGEMLAYLSQSRRFAIVASASTMGQNIEDALSEIRMALYGRFMELASGSYAVTFVKEERQLCLSSSANSRWAG